MFTMLDVAIGLAFTYLLLSLLCTAINEWIATWSKMRGHVLKLALERMLSPDGRGDTKMADEILNQPEVRALSPKVDRPPSYLPKSIFVRAVMKTKVANARSKKEWGELFDATMERASGWFKRKMQLLSLFVAIGITVMANADTLRMADRLWRSPILRAQFVQAAQQRVGEENRRRVQANYPNPDEPVPPDSVAQERSAEDEGQEFLPVNDRERELLEGVMGWRGEFPEFNGRVAAELEAERDSACGTPGREAKCEAVLSRIALDKRVRLEGASLVPTDEWPGLSAFLTIHLLKLIWYRWAGWLLTVAAISVGAPFWFDTLNRFVNIRGTGKAPEEKEKPEDKEEKEEKEVMVVP